MKCLNETSGVIETVQVDIPASYAYLSLIGSCLSTLAEQPPVSFTETTAYNIELAVHEVCTNIIDHAYAGLPGRIQCTIGLFSHPPKIVVDLFDTGRSFDLSSAAKPDLTAPQTRGYGLFLIQNLMDQVDYHANAKGNHWRLTKLL